MPKPRNAFPASSPGIPSALLRPLTGGSGPEPPYGPQQISTDTVPVEMRDGIRLATDIHLPPVERPPVIAIRTPYGRDRELLRQALTDFARLGYAVVAQDCRGTGESEPDSWNYYVFEPEDSYDLVEWIARQPFTEDLSALAEGAMPVRPNGAWPRIRR